VSKERARRRAVREAQRAAAQAQRLRREARRARWRARLRRWTPRPRRWAWGLGRRSPGQRAFLIGVALAAGGGIWYFVESWPARVALWVLAALLLPVIAVVSFDRKGLRL
jgi:Flp pilus assembly protein TadB